MKKLNNIIFNTINNILTRVERWLNYYRRKILLSLVMIDVVTILFLVYKLIYVASKIQDTFRYRPIVTSNALLYYITFIPEFLAHCIVHPYTVYIVAFFFKYETLPILILNLLVIYFYHKWYIFVFKSRFYRRIFWGLATLIYFIVSIDLIILIKFVYPYIMIITDNGFELMAFFFCVCLYIIIYGWLIYLPETEEEKKMREEKEKNWRKK